MEVERVVEIPGTLRKASRFGSQLAGKNGLEPS